MDSSKMIDIFKNGNIVIPMYFLKNYKKFNLNMDEFILLMYLYNMGDKILFDPEKICFDLGLGLSDTMQFIDTLSSKGFIEVGVNKNEKGYMEDIILLDGFYNKLKLFVIGEVNDNKGENIENSTVFEMIESEFGRTLSSIEYEIIKAWLENNMSEDLIKEAVKEAVFNGVSNLKYIDKILYEWGKKGIRTVKDVEENRKKWNAARDKMMTTDENIDMDIMDWNWFDDEE